MSIAAKAISALRNPEKVVGHFLWHTRLCRLVTIKTDLCRLRFFPTALSCEMWLRPDRFEGDTAFIRRYLRPGDTVVDVGANVGSITLSAATLVGPGGEVLSIEAHPRTFQFLKQNIALNRCGNVTAVHTAVGDKPGTVRFTDRMCDDQNAVSTAGGGIEVPVQRLDDLVSFERVNLLKIDVEGFELFVLRGAAEVLKRTDCVFFESCADHYAKFGYGVGDVVDLLESAGFDLFQESPELPRFDRNDGVLQNVVGLRRGSEAGTRLREPASRR